MKYEIEFEPKEQCFSVMAINSGRVIGCGTASIEKDLMYLDGLHVDIPLRGKGIGTDILNLLAEEALELGANKIMGQFRPDIGYEEPAKKFYEKWGLTVEEKGIVYGDLSDRFTVFFF
jgi:GNAT superfamily N-acetyltransferase